MYTYLVGTSPNASLGYGEFWWRFSWMFTSIVLVGYASHLYFGSMRSTYVYTPTPIAATAILKKEGEYHISGSIPVPSSCHDVSVRPTQVDATKFRLIFSTWQEPSRKCDRAVQYQDFNTVVFSFEKNPEFSAVLDGRMVPLTVTVKK